MLALIMMTSSRTIEGSKFVIQAGEFNGSLELILELVEKRKLFVNEVSLARVADDFVRYTQDKQKLPLAMTAQFLVVASTLLLIKSRSLLPELELTEEEETDIKQLEKRLQIYQKVKDGANILTKNMNKQPLLKPKRSQPLPRMLVKPTDLSLQSLKEIVVFVVSEFPTFIKKPEVNVESIVSLPEMIETLSQRVKRQVRTRFSSLADRSEKGSLIVSFLALLELVHQGIVNVRQEAKFADIDIEAENVTVPAY